MPGSIPWHSSQTEFPRYQRRFHENGFTRITTKWLSLRVWSTRTSCYVLPDVLIPQHKLVDTALARLGGQGATFYYTHQNIAEFWNVMTRPVVRNGFGLTVTEAEREVRVIEAGMTFMPDGEAVYREWRRIVVQYGISGFRYTTHG